jgi:hypothetical protein
MIFQTLFSRFWAARFGRMFPTKQEILSSQRLRTSKKIEEWTIDDHNAAYDLDTSWLRRQVKSIRQENDKTAKPTQKRLILIVTHHAPSLRKTSGPQHDQNPWNSAFATDLLSQDDWNGVKIWVFGHTHYTTEFKEGNMRVVSNQRGYVLPWSSDPRNNKKDKFNVKKVNMRPGVPKITV